MSNVSVRFDHVFKRFTRSNRVRTLAELVTGLPRRLMDRPDADGLREHDFWALRDVSFELRRGETLGIIGPNGAGKSTILKLLFRILRPDRGGVAMHGRVGGLIELGAGFHPMLTGKENVFINGAILGMKRREIKRKYDSIVDFAELHEFMDMPVKNYSSGMYARLAFAIAAHAEPDILLVDEVLAVGDAPFQVKCYDWMGRIRRQGCTVVLVSHAMNVVRSATRVLHLEAGGIVKLGDPMDVIDGYLASLAQRRTDRVPETSCAKTGDGRPRAEIHRLELLSPTGAPVVELAPGDPLTIRFHYRANEPVHSPMIALSLFHDDPRFHVRAPGSYLFQVFSGDLLAGQAIEGEGVAEVTVDAVHLPVGIYRAKTYVYEGDGITAIFTQDNAAGLEVMRAEYSDRKSLIDHRQEWRVLDSSRTSSRDE